MTLSLFHLPPILYNFLPALAAGALAVISYLVAGRLVASLAKTSVTRLETFAGEAAISTSSVVPVGSYAYRVRLAFAKYGLDASGREEFLLWAARITIGGGLTLVMLVVGLPIITSLIGLVAGYVLVNGLVTRAWNRMRTDVEAEIPTLLSGLKSAISTAPNVPQALADTARTLRAGGPLRSWAEKTASQMHAEGQPCIESLRKEAAAISSSLAVCVELIGRMWTTGGQGYAQAFENAADNLRDVFERPRPGACPWLRGAEHDQPAHGVGFRDDHLPEPEPVHGGHRTDTRGAGGVRRHLPDDRVRLQHDQRHDRERCLGDRTWIIVPLSP